MQSLVGKKYRLVLGVGRSVNPEAEHLGKVCTVEDYHEVTRTYTVRVHDSVYGTGYDVVDKECLECL